MDVDEVPEAELAGEAVRATERLRGEPRQVVHVAGLAGAEQRLQERVGEHAGVELVLEPVQARGAAGMLEQRLLWHMWQSRRTLSRPANRAFR